MRMSPVVSSIAWAINASVADAVALLRSTSFVRRSALLSPFALLFVARAREGAVLREAAGDVGEAAIVYVHTRLHNQPGAQTAGGEGA